MKEIHNSFPEPNTRSSNSVGNLFSMAGQIGRAVGTLVTVMTDEEGSGSDDDMPPLYQHHHHLHLHHHYSGLPQ